jgi:hypothetical protein
MRRLSDKPVLYLLLQSVVVIVLVSTIFGTYPSPVTGGDPASYMDFKLNFSTEMFNQIRTIGYPLFLRIFRFFSPNLYLLPQTQVCLFLIAILFFYAALRIYGFSKWAAFLAASPLFYLRLIYEYSHEVLTDVPAAALAIFTVGTVFIVVRRYSSPLVYVALGFSLFLTYQFRPAYLFMIPIVPVLAVVLFAVRGEPNSDAGLIKRLGLRTAAISLFPFLFFCLFRLVTVGHFGVVSYGGMNAVGITTQFLTKEMVKDFDEDLRPLALTLIEERDRLNASVILPTAVSPTGGQIIAMPYWHEYFVAYENLAFDVIAKNFSSEAKVDLKRALPTMTVADKPIDLNRIATRLAKATFIARPVVHVIYYVKSVFYSFGFTLYAEYTIVPLLMILFLAHLVISVGGPQSTFHGKICWGKVVASSELRALISAGGLFYLAKIFMVDLVNPPTGRYLLAAAMFVPSIILSSVFVVLGTRIPSLTDR